MSGVRLTFELEFRVRLHDGRYLAQGVGNPWVARASTMAEVLVLLGEQAREHLEWQAAQGERLSTPGSAPTNQLLGCVLPVCATLLRTAAGGEDRSRPLKGAEGCGVTVFATFGFD